MTAKALATRLRLARKEMRLTQVELSKLSGVTQTTVSKIERGEQKTSSDIAVLADALNVCALWLSEGRGPMKNDTGSDNLVTSSTYMDDVMIYQYFCPRSEHGPNANDDSKSYYDSVTVSRATLIDVLDGEANLEFAIGYIHQDGAMGGTIADGDACVVRADQRSIKAHSGSIFAIADTESVSIARIRSLATGGAVLQFDSTDKTRYPDQTVTSDELSQINIIGRLCWSSGKK